MGKRDTFSTVVRYLLIAMSVVYSAVGEVDRAVYLTLFVIALVVVDLRTERERW